jgi:hypothetical protein
MLNPPTVVSVTLMIASAVNDFPVVLLSTVEIAGNCMETTLLAASVALAVWVSWYHTTCPVNGVSMPILCRAVACSWVEKFCSMLTHILLHDCKLIMQFLPGM